MSKSSSFSIEQPDLKDEDQPSGCTVHEFARNHQFIMGVVFSLTTLGIACGLIGLIAALPHSNTPWGSRSAYAGGRSMEAIAEPPAAKMNEDGFQSDFRAPLPIGRTVVETFWPLETLNSVHQPVEP